MAAPTAPTAPTVRRAPAIVAAPAAAPVVQAAPAPTAPPRRGRPPGSKNVVAAPAPTAPVPQTAPPAALMAPPGPARGPAAVAPPAIDVAAMLKVQEDLRAAVARQEATIASMRAKEPPHLTWGTAFGEGQGETDIAHDDWRVAWEAFALAEAAAGRSIYIRTFVLRAPRGDDGSVTAVPAKGNGRLRVLCAIPRNDYPAIPGISRTPGPEHRDNDEIAVLFGRIDSPEGTTFTSVNYLSEQEWTMLYELANNPQAEQPVPTAPPPARPAAYQAGQKIRVMLPPEGGGDPVAWDGFSYGLAHANGTHRVAYQGKPWGDVDTDQILPA